MDAPTCRICGKKHWSRVCDDDVTRRVTSPITVTPTVTPMVIGIREANALVAENEALRAEVAMLKRKLAEAGGGKPKPLTPAQRVAKHRAKAKQVL